MKIITLCIYTNNDGLSRGSQEWGIKTAPEPNQALLGTSPGSVFFLFLLNAFRALPYKPSNMLMLNPLKYNNFGK